MKKILIILLGLVLLSSVNAYDEDDIFTNLIYNSKYCVDDCIAIYELCNPSIYSIPLTDLVTNFEFGNVKNSHISYELDQDKFYKCIVDTEIIEECEENNIITNIELNQSKKELICQNVTKNIFADDCVRVEKDFVEVYPGDILESGECIKIKINGSIGTKPNKIEWIPEITIQGEKFSKPEWDIWINNYTYEIPINFSNYTTDHLGFLNHSNGLWIGGVKQYILSGSWGVNVSVRFNTANDCIVVNATQQIPSYNVEGTCGNYSITSIFESTIKGAYIPNDNGTGGIQDNDLSINGNDGINTGAILVDDCFFGGCAYFKGISDELTFSQEWFPTADLNNMTICQYIQINDSTSDLNTQEHSPTEEIGDYRLFYSSKNAYWYITSRDGKILYPTFTAPIGQNATLFCATYDRTNNNTAFYVGNSTYTGAETEGNGNFARTVISIGGGDAYYNGYLGGEFIWEEVKSEAYIYELHYNWKGEPGFGNALDLILHNKPPEITVNYPTDNLTNVNWSYCVNLNVTLIDNDGNTMNVSFYNDSAFILCNNGSDFSNNSQVYCLWCNLTCNRTFTWYANVTDGYDEVTTGLYNFTMDDCAGEEEEENYSANCSEGCYSVEINTASPSCLSCLTDVNCSDICGVNGSCDPTYWCNDEAEPGFYDCGCCCQVNETENTSGIIYLVFIDTVGKFTDRKIYIYQNTSDIHRYIMTVNFTDVFHISNGLHYEIFIEPKGVDLVTTIAFLFNGKIFDYAMEYFYYVILILTLILLVGYAFKKGWFSR